MKKFLAVVVFCLPAFGQASYSGLGLYSGPAAYGAAAGGEQFYAALPQIWVDNNELTCGLTSSCYPGSPGLSLTAPAYELELGAGSGGGGLWISGPPAGCTFALANYTANGDGKQNAIDDMEACRTLEGGNVGIILDQPPEPPGTYVRTSATGCAGCGIIIPQTSNTLASAPLIVRSTYDSTLAAMPEPVCAGGIQDNLATSTNIGLDNPDCTGQNMYYQLGPTNLYGNGVLAGITTVSVSTTAMAPVTSAEVTAGTPVLIPLVNGYVSPTLAPSPTPCIEIDAAGTHGTPECVTPVSGVNQIGLYAVFTQAHTYGFTATYTPNANGTPAGCTGSGSFVLANGTCKNISQYNYQQYMYVDQASTTTSGYTRPFQLCGAGPGDNPACANGNNSLGTSIGPDHWEFMDGVAERGPGDTADSELIFTGDSDSQTTLTQFAQHIHFRRYVALGNWTSLAAGSNSNAVGFNLSGINYGSLVGSQGSQLLRPGSEGHVSNINSNTVKLVNDWLEGQSSPIFPGGFGSAPGILGWVAATDVQVGRIHATFPYSWLGANGVNGSSNQGQIPNNNAYWGGAEPPWFVGPTMVTTNGTTVTWSSGDPFHDSNSNWLGDKVVINGVAGYKISSMGSGSCPLSCPTTLTLTTSAGVQSTPVTFTLNSASLVRKNALEFKQGQRIVIYGSIFEDNDESGGQNGTCTTMDTRNTSGTEHGLPVGQDYQAVTTDLTITDSIFRNCLEGMAFGARGPYTSGVTSGSTRWNIANVLEYSITGVNPGGNFETPGITIAGGEENWNATVTENSAGTQATAYGFANIDSGIQLTAAAAATTCPTGFSGNCTTYTVSNSTADTNGALCGPSTSSPVNTGSFLFVLGFSNSGNNAPAPTGFECAGSTATSVVLVNPAGVNEPSPPGVSTYQCAAGAATACANPVISNATGVGYQVLNIRTGEPVPVFGCNNTNFNVSTYSISGNLVPTGIGAQPLVPLAVIGSAVWSGTWGTANSSVTYAWTAAANASDTSGTCFFNNNEGDPFYTNITHHTLISDSIQTMGNGPAPKNGGPSFLQNNLIRDSILLSQYEASNAGIYNSSASKITPADNGTSEGTNTTAFDWDISSLTLDHVVWSGRNPSGACSPQPSCYTAYGNNINYPSASPVQYFPATDFCSDATYAASGSNCVAFVGGMSVNPVMNAMTLTGGNITSGVLTACASSAPPFVVNERLILAGTSESYLQGQQVVVNSLSVGGACSPSYGFTASYNHANATFSESGSCTFTNGVSSGPCAVLDPMPLTLADYHGYELRSDSPYYHAASDGSDIGAIIPTLDTAQTTTTYVCASACGSPGPFPD